MKHIFWALPLSVLVMLWAVGAYGDVDKIDQSTASPSDIAVSSFPRWPVVVVIDSWSVVENQIDGTYKVKEDSMTVSDIVVGNYRTANIAADVAFSLNAAHQERMDEIEYREKSK